MPAGTEVLGVSVAPVAGALQRNLPLIVGVSGVLIIEMGLASLGVVRTPCLYRERRIDMARVPRGPRSGLVLGATFGFGWVRASAPCWPRSWPRLRPAGPPPGAACS